MNNAMKRSGCMLAASALVVSLAACSGNDANSGNNEEPANAAQPGGAESEPPKLSQLTYWVGNHAAAAASMKTYAEMGMYREREKASGVKVDFQHPPLDAAQAKEQFNLMIVGSDLPDVIEYNWNDYLGGPEKAIQDNKIIKLNDLIDQYAPNLKKLLDEHPDWKKQITTDNGSIYAFPFLRGDDKVRVFFGPAIRQDWLDKLGLAKPETIDDWYGVLKAFKEKDPNGNGQADEIPLYLDKDHFNTDAPFLGAWGVNNGFYQDNGTVKFGPIQPQFKAFLETMNKWYEEGLLDQDFAAPNGKLLDNKMTTNLLGATATYNGGGIGKYAGLMKDKDPSFKLVAAPYPVLKAGDQAIWGQKDFAFNGIGAAITTSDDNPIETVKWLDYAYGAEGELLFNYGIEGESYTLQDGKAVLKPELLTPPNGTSSQQAIAKYTRATWSAPFVLSDNFQLQYLALPQQKEALEIWSKPTAERKMPLVTPTQDESSKFASIMTDINTYKDEMLLKFIMGVEPLDEFDGYVEKIKSMGIDDALKIQQAALERFAKR
ncbi:ABC transporter substrate-binding protein [Paenibacillus methanolicus]|uniref:Putative aldouronate transport system substrate-binding protein n=1 Tax=Paenibacillus methanolicus TaxID=582686 RepID=A0A5S5C1S3_9BACL|nr:ABC transporter substrate-binding protein [Paenibacillus methanolicus]TYP73119.1 putative aldouronate transport system substrate-binding protein [Paenibacillus methanolicus]